MEYPDPLNEQFILFLSALFVRRDVNNFWSGNPKSPLHSDLNQTSAKEKPARTRTFNIDNVLQEQGLVPAE